MWQKRWPQEADGDLRAGPGGRWKEPSMKVLRFRQGCELWSAAPAETMGTERLRKSSGDGEQKASEDAFLEVSKVANKWSLVGSGDRTISKNVNPTSLLGAQECRLGLHEGQYVWGVHFTQDLREEPAVAWASHAFPGSSSKQW